MGMAMLQVIILPLMREAGGEVNYAFYAVLAQIVFGSASFLSPFVLTKIMHLLSEDASQDSVFIGVLRKVAPEGLSWGAFYFLFAIVFALMLVVISCIKFPKVVLKDDEKTGTFQNYIDLLKKKQVILYFLGIVAYVGTEQGLATWMSQFLKTYHQIDPAGTGATAVAWFWGLMSLGCLLGLVIVKLIDSKIMLRIFAVLAIINLAVALFGAKEVSVIAFSCCGFSISIMFSVIFSLALNSEEKHHGVFSGILCTGIFGGALVPFIIGWIGDHIGLRLAMLFLFITLSYILSISFFAKPLVKNKTIRVSDWLENIIRENS